MRHATAVILAVAIAAGVTAWLLMRSGSSDPSRESTAVQPPKAITGTFGSFGIPYGMRGKELAARFGEPDQKRNSCWIYRIRGATFHGIEFVPETAGMDAVRYCFYAGVVAIIEDHWRKVNGTYPSHEPWTAPVTFGCGSSKCHSSV